ncbi:hypothetical protein [Reyranella sp.]|uniref:hypothetical protein n=1 Tax=Reyranella sp. TaxID=1929291 RepID=UPI003D0EA5CE
MKHPIALAILAIAAGVAVTPVIITSAEAQVPPRGGAWGDRDRDGVPNVVDPQNNNRPRAWGDKDHDGVPNPYDRTTTASKHGTRTATACRIVTTASTIASCRTGIMTAFPAPSTGTTGILTASTERSPKA